MKPGITGLVLTYNGERLIERCLASLSFCDEILVVDSFSSDATVAIAQGLGARVLQRAWEGPGPQFEYARDLVETQWVFSLDQDEICSRALRESVATVVSASETETADGFWIPRRSWYFDRFMRHSGWYPDYLLRFFKKDAMRVHVSGAHYTFVPEGETRRLAGDILHYPYSGFSQHLEKINDYAQKGAEELARNNRPGGLARGIGHGAARFAKNYVFKLGFLDGRAGFINAVHGAMYAFLKYVRVNEGSFGAPYDHDE